MGSTHSFFMLKRWTRSQWVKLVCVMILTADIVLQPWLAQPVFGPGDIAFYRDVPESLHVQGYVGGEPDVRSDSQNLVIEVRKIFLPQVRDVHGKLLIKTDRYPEYIYGEELDVTCKLQTPPVFENFSYAALLAKDDIFVYCTRPLLHQTDGNPGAGDILFQIQRWFWRGIFALKSHMIERINRLYSEPSASLAAGILIGQRRAIPQDILDNFNTAGLTHVLAISGYNVSMMIMVFGYLFQNAARRSRYLWMFFGVMVLVVFTGFSASVLRAAWMGSIALVAQALGRKGSALHLLLVSGVIMVLMSPRMILVDLSFQLSFLSTLGILVFMPKIEAFEAKLVARSGFGWVAKIPAFMREGFCVTLAAQVFTIPLLFYQFGRFSLIAPVANIFVLPLIPWIMLFSFCGLMISFVFFPLGQLLSFIAYVLITLMLLFVDFFAHVPFAALQF